MTSVLPDDAEFAALTPQPGSPVWRAFNDARSLSSAGYATLLQVCHPTVGAGVHDYSSFTIDPWGRLLRTLDYVNGTIYGGPEMAGEIGRRVRAIHTTIKGHRHDGPRYHALEPEAFAWVHATLAASIVESHRRLIRPLTTAEKTALWEQWLDVGRLIGVRTRDLPPTWAGFEAYFHHMVEEELTWTPAVPEVLAIYDIPPPGRLRSLPPFAWQALSFPVSRQLRLMTTGMVPRTLRQRLGLSWSRADAVAFEVACTASRASGPLQPPQLRNFGERYARWRREALERGDVASTAPMAAA
jgi:uncharacterized protein (DUF2236 family)